MSREEMYNFMVTLVFQEIQQVKQELTRRINDKDRHRLRYTLRQLCFTLARLLEISPEQTSEQEILDFFKVSTPKGVARRIRLALEKT